MHIELRDLAYFLACLEHGSLTAAGARLHVSQPTLSHALARLERALGETLLARPANRRLRLRPTAAGKAAAERARRALAEVGAIGEDLAALRGELQGDLRIGAVQSVNATILPTALAGFAQRHPRVRLVLRTWPAEALPGALREDRIDVAILAGAPAAALRDLVVHPLRSEEFVAIVRSTHALARTRGRVPLARLAAEPLALVPSGTFAGDVIGEACRSAGFDPRPVLELESGEALRETVRAGLGITILPEGYLAPHDRGLRAVRLRDPTPSRQVIACTDARTTPSRAVAAFLAILRQRPVR